MKPIPPSAEDAQASLREVTHRAATVRRADNQFRPILLALAAIYLVIGALVSASPRGGNVLVSGGVIAALLAGTIGGIYLVLRMRAWSRTGILWFLGSVAAFLIWNAAVIWASIATGWWGPHEPGLHFGGSVVVAVVPLVVAACLLGRR